MHPDDFRLFPSIKSPKEQDVPGQKRFKRMHRVLKGIFTERSTDVSREPGSLHNVLSTGDHQGERGILCSCWQTNNQPPLLSDRAHVGALGGTSSFLPIKERANIPSSIEVPSQQILWFHADF